MNKWRSLYYALLGIGMIWFVFVSIKTPVGMLDTNLKIGECDMVMSDTVSCKASFYNYSKTFMKQVNVNLVILDKNDNVLSKGYIRYSDVEPSGVSEEYLDMSVETFQKMKNIAYNFRYTEGDNDN